MPNLRQKLVLFFGDILQTEYLQRFARSFFIRSFPYDLFHTFFGVGIFFENGQNPGLLSARVPVGRNGAPTGTEREKAVPGSARRRLSAPRPGERTTA